MMQLLESLVRELKIYLGEPVEEQTIRDNYATLHNVSSHTRNSFLFPQHETLRCV